MMELPFKLTGNIVVLFLAMSVRGTPAPGFLDPSFGGTGLVQLGFGGSASVGKAVALQSDGKIVMAGQSSDASAHIVVARFGTNNVLDPTFGTAGLARVGAGSYPTVAAVAIQRDGKIVVGGSFFSGGPSGYDFIIVRFNPDGTLDNTFASGGVLIQDLGGGDTCNGLVLQPDGKIVVAGISLQGPGEFPTNYMVLARFDTNGVFDPSFASNGKFQQTVYSRAYCLALEGDGNILVGGYLNYNGVFRFTTNGSPDAAFGSGGEVVLTNAQVSSVAIQPGGNFVSQPAMILAAGTLNGNAMIARMSLAGVFDTALNGTGVVTQPIGGSGLYVTGLTPKITGLFGGRIVKIVIGGYFSNGAKNEFVAARFNNNGSLDTSFGGSGVVTTSLSPGDDQAFGLAQPGGALLLAGVSAPSQCETDFSLARYNSSDGSLDTNFNGTGILLQRVGDSYAEADSVAIQPDGRIVVGGTSSSCNASTVICRFNPDGTLDASFATGGELLTNLAPAQYVRIQPDGKILMAGGNGGQLLLARFLSNGVPDVSFASTGSFSIVVGTNGTMPFGMALQSDGKIVVGVRAFQGGNDLAVIRFNSSGSIDTNWNGSGSVFTALVPPNDTFGGVAIQADGKVVASGYSTLSSYSEFSMFRCTANGPLDSSFGSSGRVATQVSNGDIDAGFGLALQPDGKIVLAGTSLPSMALLRYNGNGSLDSTFGSGGKMTARIGFAVDIAYAVALQNDGKIVTGCRSQVDSFYKFAVARFLTNGVLDPNYGVSGVNTFDFGTGADELVNAMALDSAGRMVMVGTIGSVFGIVRVTGDPFLRITSITKLPNGHMLLKGLGVPGGNHTMQSSPRFSPAAFTPLGPVTADATGAWMYEDATASTSSNRCYRLSYP
jgi:uncharacterized delta-60 repeat protein